LVDDTTDPVKLLPFPTQQDVISATFTVTPKSDGSLLKNGEDLYIHIEDSDTPPAAIWMMNEDYLGSSNNDPEGDNFEDRGILLNTQFDHLESPAGYGFTFDEDQLEKLIAYAEDGSFNLLIDTDFNSDDDWDFALEIQTSPVPVPGSLGLLHLGLLGVVGFSRKRRMG
jgi:hypothetical protein